MKKTTYSVSIFIAFLVISFTTTAQKLPDVQQISLRAPADIKIDGKATEWNYQFQADNNTTHIEYTLSNDDKNLYLTVQITDHTIIAKSLLGGISLTINTSGKKEEKNAANITYPAFEKGRQNLPGLNFRDTKPGTDSLAMANNSELAAKSKFIRVTGIKGMDTLTSIYNREGIKAVSLFDNNMVYTYELSIDLKLLDLDTANPKKISYNIALQGKPSLSDLINSHFSTPPTHVHVTYIPTPGHPTPYTLDNPHGYLLNVPTDFWGDYTLVK